MVRVLQVVTNMDRGGLETMLMNYYRHIDREKVQFDFLEHRYTRSAYDNEIEALGGKICRLPRLVPWGKNYLNALDRFFTGHLEYKIIHVHQDCLSSVILKAAERHGIPVRIAHSHNASQNKNLKYPIKLWYKRSIPDYATHLFACSMEAGEWMFNRASFQILNNAVDALSYSFDSAKRNAIREQLGLTNQLTIGHIGRFSPQKNHPFLLEVFAALLRREPTAVLLLVGVGADIEKIRAKAEAMGLSQKVRFLGVRSDVSDLLQAMDVFLFPSLYEGLPVTLIEAQAAGLPCVISDVISDQCMITDLVSIRKLADPPEEWANAIMEKAGLPRRNTQSEIIAAGFDVTKNAEWLQEFYLSQWKTIEQCQR
ncbi:MAG: glycosyltransferase family 1 protein [Oscillospiraceae bacterium]|nr:glycosyltransferase family 1 protein [Oscillospiraceae bacterium]